MIEDSNFPSQSTEKKGHFVSISESVGHALTYKVLTKDTHKIIFRSHIRSALNPAEKNLHIDPDGGEDSPIIKSKNEYCNGETIKMPMFDPSGFIGCTFLKESEEDGQHFCTKIVEAIVENEEQLANEPEKIKFCCSVNDDEYEEIITYNEILAHLDKDSLDAMIVWRFKSITAHEGPLKPGDPSYNGSKYNVLVNWETGESTFEPLHIIAADDPVTCAVYAKDNDLLNLDGWKCFNPIAKHQKKLLWLVNQAKLQSFCHTPVYQYGYLVPQNHDQAMELDYKNGNKLWKESEEIELEQINEFNVFNDLGKGGRPPPDYKKIRVHFVYAVKHDGRHKSRLVAGGHLTKVPLDSIYSGVISLCGIRLIIFLAELNDLEVWGTDIGNAYLEAPTKERMYIVASPEFGELEGHTLVIVKALYGLHSSGLRWHEKFADTLRDMGFYPSKAEEDIWMHKNGDVYEYIAVYVDDLCIAAKNPQEIADILENKYKYKLKGTGPIQFHLGCDFFHDQNGILCFAPKKYIAKMVNSYKQIFGDAPPTKGVNSPLVKGDHPELDTSEELNEDERTIYQSLIGAMQWSISLGQIDIMTAVMTMSGFCTNPRWGHLEHCKHIYGYLSKMKDAMVHVWTDEPNYSGLPEQDFDWARTIYGDVKEVVPEDIPEPLGKFVMLTTYINANLYHNMITGWSVTGILHLINKTPFDWYSKKQGTVETVTYGSEFVAARIATEQVIDHRLTLCYLGVPICEKTYMFRDNKSVVDSSSKPQSKLHKRHTALSFHHVCEAIAAKIIAFYHLPGHLNPADILSKHWGYSQVWPQLKAFLFWQGDTYDLLDLELVEKA